LDLSIETSFIQEKIYQIDSENPVFINPTFSIGLFLPKYLQLCTFGKFVLFEKYQHAVVQIDDPAIVCMGTTFKANPAPVSAILK